MSKANQDKFTDWVIQRHLDLDGYISEVATNMIKVELKLSKGRPVSLPFEVVEAATGMGTHAPRGFPQHVTTLLQKLTPEYIPPANKDFVLPWVGGRHLKGAEADKAKNFIRAWKRRRENWATADMQGNLANTRMRDVLAEMAERFPPFQKMLRNIYVIITENR